MHLGESGKRLSFPRHAKPWLKFVSPVVLRNPSLGRLHSQLRCFFEFFQSGHGASRVVYTFCRLRASVAFSGGIMF